MFIRTRKFLWISFSCLIILSIAVFIWISVSMTSKSKAAINEIGTIYMSEMNSQIQQKFKAIVDLRLSQVEGIIQRTPQGEDGYSEELMDDLALNASVRNFTYLAFYDENGECEVIYGEPVEIIDEEEFMRVLNDKQMHVSSALDKEEEKVLLLAVDAEYDMKSGEKSTCLVAGIGMDTLNREMVLEGDGSLIYSHIIRKDGSYIVRNGNAYRENYFTRMGEMIAENNGKDAEKYIQELKNAMAAGEDYSSLVIIEGTSRNLYCAPLAECEWYLINVMPYGTLDDRSEERRVGKECRL